MKNFSGILYYPPSILKLFPILIDTKYFLLPRCRFINFFPLNKRKLKKQNVDIDR